MMKDLLILVADVDAEYTVKGLLSRPESLNIAKIQPPTIVPHLLRDNGCCHGYEDMLRGYVRDHRYAIIMFDKHGSGREEEATADIENDIEQRLARTGWNERCAAIVLEPELESWVWSDSPHVGSVLGWKTLSELREWLEQQQLWKADNTKPEDPKEAFKAACRKGQRRISASLFNELASKVQLKHCEERSFLKFKTTLQVWFPLER